MNTDICMRSLLTDPSSFFLEHALKELDWFEKPSVGYSGKITKPTWFRDGVLNISHNCIDRHAAKNPNKTAIIWQGDEKENTKNISYDQLLTEVSKLANGLKSIGVKKGDRVCIYMPMIPEAAYSMLACMRIGAIHSVVFGGFSPEAISSRILDSDCQYVITADEGIRGGKRVNLKENIDIALKNCPNVQKTIVFKYTNANIDWVDSRDVCYNSSSVKCPMFVSLKKCMQKIHHLFCIHQVQQENQKA